MNDLKSYLNGSLDVVPFYDSFSKMAVDMGKFGLGKEFNNLLYNLIENDKVVHFLGGVLGGNYAGFMFNNPLLIKETAEMSYLIDYIKNVYDLEKGVFDVRDMIAVFANKSISDFDSSIAEEFGEFLEANLGEFAGEGSSFVQNLDSTKNFFNTLKQANVFEIYRKSLPASYDWVLKSGLFDVSSSLYKKAEDYISRFSSFDFGSATAEDYADSFFELESSLSSEQNAFSSRISNLLSSCYGNKLR